MHKHDFDAGSRRENSLSLCTLPSHPSLHTLVRCVNTRIGWPQRLWESTHPTVATHFFAIHLFFPFSFFVYFSSFSFSSYRSLFSPFSSIEFFLLAHFYGFPPDARLRVPLILLCRIALLCIISIAAGRPEVHIPLPHARRFLIYILDVCMLTRGRINAERERKVSQGVGRKKRGEARVCRFLLRYIVTCNTHTRDTYSCCRRYVLHRKIYRSIKVEHFDDKSAAIRAGMRE